MILAIDITDGHGLSSEASHKLLPKKSKVMNATYVSCSFHIKSCITTCTLLTRQSTLVLKVGVMWVAKLIKEDWPVVLQ